MTPTDLLLLALLALLVTLITLYLRRAKKKGKGCVGCPYAGACTFCSCQKNESEPQNGKK